MKEKKDTVASIYTGSFLNGVISGVMIERTITSGYRMVKHLKKKEFGKATINGVAAVTFATAGGYSTYTLGKDSLRRLANLSEQKKHETDQDDKNSDINVGNAKTDQDDKNKPV